MPTGRAEPNGRLREFAGEAHRHIAAYVAAPTPQRQARSFSIAPRHGGSSVRYATYRYSRAGHGQVDSGGGRGR